MRFAKRNMAAARLNAAAVQEIRMRYAEGETQGALCREYGVSAIQIGRIVRGESWGHLPMPQRSERQEQAEIERLLRVQQEVELQRDGRTSTQVRPPISVSPLDGGDAPETGTGTLERLEQHVTERNPERLLDELKGAGK